MLSELFDIWNSGDFSMLQVIILLASYAVLIFVTLPVHEFAHAVAAYKLGDETAKWNGRLTLNPLKHLDTFGTLMMVLVGIGYAKPVPVNPYYFRNPKKGMALTALAGPLSNVVMALVAVALFRVISLVCGNGYWLYLGAPFQSFVGSAQYAELLWYVQFFLINVFASINVSLAVFNLLPIPPLDGSRIFASILPAKWAYVLESNERYITMGLFVLLFLGVLDEPLYMLHRGFGFVICTLFGMPNIF